MKGRAAILSLAILLLLVPGLARAGGEIPEAIKKIAPEYPNAKVRETMNLPHGMGVILSASDSPEKVVDFYRKSLVPLGWTVGFEKNQNQNIKIQFIKGDQQLQVTAFNRKGGGATFLLYVPKGASSAVSEPAEPKAQKGS